VLTFNVHRDRSDDERTIAAIGAAGADIVCLQETTADWMRVIEERYHHQYAYMLFAPKENAGGLAVLSHFPLVDRGVMPVPGDWHPAWHVLVHTPGGPVQLLNVHLRSMFEGDGLFVTNYAATGNDHVYEMSLFMEGALADVPMIIAGDFNESPDGKAVRWLEARGFQNALSMFKPEQSTWQGGSVAKSLTMTIDHVMFDGALEPLDAWVGPKSGSDHRPVVAWLELVPRDRAERTKVPTWAPTAGSEDQTEGHVEVAVHALDRDLREGAPALPFAYARREPKGSEPDGSLCLELDESLVARDVLRDTILVAIEALDRSVVTGADCGR
jgi:endonuclease/exonuclease/phosphatase (EEP) superfamily protein YafD